MKLVLANDDDKRARDRQAHAAWGARLSVDEYVARVIAFFRQSLQKCRAAF